MRQAQLEREALSRIILLPIVHSSIQLAIDWQVGSLIGILRHQRFLDVHAEASRFSRMHNSVFEGVRMRKNFISFRSMPHIFLNPEIVDTQIEV